MKVFVGYDAREPEAYKVCVRSLLKHSSIDLDIIPLLDADLRAKNLYRRQYKQLAVGPRYDFLDGKPFSTDFAFTRFLVPSLCDFGPAVFCDADFLWRGDINSLLDHFDNSKAVLVVQHDHKPDESEKMDHMIQESYPRKNWSSLILWNCSHYACRALTPEYVNTKPGSDLHGFKWVDDDHIGSLPVEWNYLVGWNTKEQCEHPSAVHFTNGIPTMPGWWNQEYASEWLSTLREIQ
ncbi:MAG: glycosyltransferase [Myxococcales bacterium]|jgi:lipopolysaccharide biosynthesis glycosyltransferase|nr:MAG: glycosyltransferase [Myxococcales bacterium]